MNKIFLSKENTSKLYKNILEENKLQAMPRKTKELVVSQLVSNMKEIYKHIDTSKVNQSNINHILGQFNNMCIKETSKSIKNSQILNGEDSQISRVKFARDFNSTPNKKVQFMERPKHMNQGLRNQNSNSTLDSMAMQSSSNLDNMFQPITNSTYDPNMSVESDIDINKKMEMMNQMRQMEETRSNQRPPTPDFLKSQKTQKTSYDDRVKESNFPNNNSNFPNSNFPSNNNSISNFPGSNDSMAFNGNFTNSNSNELSSYNESGGSGFTSIDEMNKPLIQGEIVEDNASFEDRLKRLQSERDNFVTDIPPQQQQQQQQQQKEETFKRQQQQQQQQQQETFRRQREQQTKVRDDESEDSNSTMMNMLLQRLNNLENSNSSNVSSQEINNLREENKRLQEEINQIQGIKSRISNEFEDLNKKNEEIQTSMQKLNQRELELNSRENEIKVLINNYKQILNSRFYQMNLTSKDNKSNYKYYFNKVDNIVAIKIISYSMPYPRYNISGNNNILKYKYDDKEEESILLDNGKYSIENLIEKINFEFEKKEINIKFKLNINQKITVESDKDFKLLDNNLKNITLGIDQNDICEKKENDSIDTFVLDGSNLWDLRVEDKLFLYFKNINDDPISIVYLNGTSEAQIQFEEPIELDILDVELRDSYGNLYDFNNLPHSINLQLELTNQFVLDNSNLEYNVNE